MFGLLKKAVSGLVDGIRKKVEAREEAPGPGLERKAGEPAQHSEKFGEPAAAGPERRQRPGAEPARPEKIREAEVVVEAPTPKTIEGFEKLPFSPSKPHQNHLEGFGSHTRGGYSKPSILQKRGQAPEPKAAEEEERLKLIVYAKEGCGIVPGLQEKFRTYCRTERMKAEKNANLAERVKDIVTFAGPVVTTYGLSLAVYEGLIELAKHMPLIIDTAADGVLVSGLVPRKVETRYREKAKLLEKLENAEIDIIPQHSDGACPRKGFYSQMTGHA